MIGNVREFVSKMLATDGDSGGAPRGKGAREPNCSRACVFERIEAGRLKPRES